MDKLNKQSFSKSLKTFVNFEDQFLSNQFSFLEIFSIG